MTKENKDALLMGLLPFISGIAGFVFLHEFIPTWSVLLAFVASAVLGNMATERLWWDEDGPLANVLIAIFSGCLTYLVVAAIHWWVFVRVPSGDPF